MPSQPQDSNRSPAGRLALAAGITATLLPFLFIPYYMITTSLKAPIDIVRGTGLVSFSPTLTNYIEAFRSTQLGGMIFNSLVIGVLSTLLSLTLGLPAAFAIAKYRRRATGLLLIGARAVPAISLLVPYFIVFSRLGLIDSYPGLILAHTIFTLPLVTWIMVGFFEDLPPELEESALVDGATEVQAFIRVILPVARGGIAATAILAFIFSWNNLIFAAALAGPNTRTVPLAAFDFLSFEAIEWGPIAAAATVIALPVVVLALLVQRQLVRGLVSGAVKG